MGEMKVEIIPVLHDMAIIWATLFILMSLLKKFAYGPITKMIDGRRDKIVGEIEEAKLLNQQAEDMKQEYENKLAESKAERQELLMDARSRGEEVKNEIIEEAKREASAIKDKARRDIDNERKAAFQNLKTETGDMALLIASKLIGEEIKLENQNGLIDKFIDEVGNSKWQN